MDEKLITTAIEILHFLPLIMLTNAYWMIGNR